MTASDEPDPVTFHEGFSCCLVLRNTRGDLAVTVLWVITFPAGFLSLCGLPVSSLEVTWAWWTISSKLNSAKVELRVCSRSHAMWGERYWRLRWTFVEQKPSASVLALYFVQASILPDPDPDPVWTCSSFSVGWPPSTAVLACGNRPSGRSKALP